MKILRSRAGSPLSIGLVGLLVLAACSNGGSTNGDGGPTGSVFVSGSSTVEPISLANAEKFAGVEPNVDISVEGPGTSDGFALFCAGESDVSDASRAIKQEEIDTCAANDIEFIELYVAIDGLSVVTSSHNDSLDCLSFTDLWALLGPDAPGNGSRWSDADSLAQETAEATDEEFGAIHAPYPDAAISITAPGEESGTFDSFVEIVLDPVGGALEVEDVTTTANYQASADDNVIIQGLAGTQENPYTLGWVGYAYYQENTDVVKALEVDGREGCVAPTVETIASGEFPIARPLFVYVNAQRAAENEALAAFIDFYLSDEGRASVPEVGYVDIPDEDWQATVATWEDRTTGTQAGE
ncbi:MAG: substrate-binding domain-containing protein [Candidatus Limnocylindria bacterium]